MKNKKKIIVCICIFICVILSTHLICYADDTSGNSNSSQQIFSDAIDIILKLGGSVVGLYTWPFKLFILAVSVAIQFLMSTLAVVGGGNSDIILTPFAILFNKVEAIKIDFFDFNSTADFVNTFRQNIAMWYYVLRFIATAILLAILIYIGIRMAISTVADEKARYKKMIVDWVVSLALLFLLHYIIVFVINLNTIFVNMIASVGEDLDLGILVAGWLTQAVSPVSGIGGWAACMLYVIFVWQTLKFFILYVKRMITIGFLILISPLITITYSIDRAGDQKAQALNTWLKEFIYNVLIQPFHCILYLAFAHAAFKSIVADTDNAFLILAGSVFGWGGEIAGMFFAILCLIFVNSGEKLIREIFGFKKASSVGDLVGAAAIATGVFTQAKNIGGAIGKSGASLSKAMFPGIGSIGQTIASSKFGQSRTGQALAGVGNSIRSTVGGIGTTISNTVVATDENGQKTTLGDVFHGAAQTASRATAAAGQRFTASVGSLKRSLNDFKTRHPIATEIFGSGKTGVIRYFRYTGNVMKDSNTWKAVGMVQGIGLGLGMEGNLFQTALYASVFSGIADSIANASGVNRNRAAREVTEDLGKSVKIIENVTETTITDKTEFIKHLREIITLGDTGYYDPEKINASRNRFFTVIQNSVHGSEPISPIDLSRAFNAMHAVFESGGSTNLAIETLDKTLRESKYTLDARKLTDVKKMVVEMQKQEADSHIYRAWEEAKKHDISEDLFAQIILENKPTTPGPEDQQLDDQYSGFGHNFEIDPATRKAVTDFEDSATKATKDIQDTIKELNNNNDQAADAAQASLTTILSQMASQINDYQSDPNHNELILVKMIDIHNVTAERTNKIRLDFDASKVASLPEVKKFTKDSNGQYTQS